MRWRGKARAPPRIEPTILVKILSLTPKFLIMREEINDRDDGSDGVLTVSEFMEPSRGHAEEHGADIDAAARQLAHARLGGSAVEWLARTWPDAAFEWPTFWENWVDEFDATEASERRRRAVGSTAVERSIPAVGINGGSENGGGGVLAAERSALEAGKHCTSHASLASARWLWLARGLEGRWPACTARPPGR